MRTLVILILLSTFTLAQDLPHELEKLKKARDNKIEQVDAIYAKELKKLKVEFTRKGDLTNALKIDDELKLYERLDSSTRGFNAGHWSSEQNDADWRLKGNTVVRKRNSFNSTFQYNKAIPSGFECRLGIKLLGLKRGDGRGVTVTDAYGKNIALTIGDTTPFGIYDSASGYVAMSSNIKLKNERKYDVEFRVENGSVTAKLDKETLTAKWEGTPPYKLSLFCQRSGMEATDLSIKVTE